jgi:hypothetical protein
MCELQPQGEEDRTSLRNTGIYLQIHTVSQPIRLIRAQSVQYNQCYFSKETDYGTYTKIDQRGGTYRNSTKYATLLERRVVG